MMVAYALWVVTVIALIVAQLAGGLHQSVVEERTATERAELRAAAISGLEAYRFLLAETANGQYSHRQEVFRCEPTMCVFQTGDRVRTICFNVEETNPASGISYGATDEEGRVNVLKADPELLGRLPGVTIQMAENLASYIEVKPALVPRTLHDLRVVPGWGAVDTRKLRQLVTFYGSGRVNLNTASPDVLSLLGVSGQAIGTMMSFLSGPNGVGGDEDDLYFKGLSEIEPRLQDFGANTRTLDEWNEVIQQGHVDVLSRYYRIRARSYSESSGQQYEIDSIVCADSLGAIVSWQEYQPA